jgi:16S rRNA (cytosine967-C5)-methyltransferase
VAALALTQRRILAQCLTLLKPGGRLVYSTCSLLPAENEQLLAAALAGSAHARSVPLELPSPLPAHARTRALGLQLLPGAEALSDGFYYACVTVT